MNCPAPKAAVIAAIRREADAGSPPATRRASCSPPIVITINVPPTHTAQNISAARLRESISARSPAAITSWAKAQRRRGSMLREAHPTITVDSAAAKPNTGQVHPNTAGSGISSRAIAGRKVAGTMYAKPKAP